MMVVLVSKQHEVITECRQHRISALFVSWEKTSYKNAGQVGFTAGQVDFQVTCPAGPVAVEPILRPGNNKTT